MNRRKIVPTYRLHKKSGKAIVSVYSSDGRRHGILLPGKYESKESRAEYNRIIARLDGNDGILPAEKVATLDLTVADLIARYMKEHVLPYYVNPITKEPTGEQENFRCAMLPLNRLFGTLSVSEFGPLCLVKVRTAMIDGSWMNDEERKKHADAGRKQALARTTVNTRIGRIKMMFRWGTEMQMIPPSIYHGVLAVACLKTGRSAARDTEDVRPVPLSFVKLTQIHLPPVVQDIVELLVLTGMRVGEAVIMRAIDLDMTGKVWLYKPRYHKNLWRGHTRKIAIGPRGQLILRKYLTPKVDAYVFSPRQQQVLINAEKRAGRKTKVQPSQLCRKKAHPRKKLGERFLSGDINAAIQRACGRAKVSPWHTHQLRHTAALEVSRQHGLEAARAMLGQKTVQVSAHYAGIDEKLAKHVARKIG